MKKNIIRVIEIGLIVFVVVVAAVNLIFLNNKAFWEVSISQVLTLLVAIVIAFWAAQKKTDERKIKEQIEKITNKIQTVIEDPKFILFNSTDNPDEVQKRITMSTRKLSNGIDVLREYGKSIDISAEVEYIAEQVRGYNDLVSVKINDLDYLSKSESHLRMYAENINSKCDYIIMKLYTNNKPTKKQ